MNSKIFAAIVLAITLLGESSYGQNESVGMRFWPLISDPSNERPAKVAKNDVRRGWLCANGTTGRLLLCPVEFEIFDSMLPISIPNVVTDCVLDSNGSAVPGTCADGGHRHMNASNVTVGVDRPELFRVGTNPPPPAFEDVRYPNDADNEPRTVTGAFSSLGPIFPADAFTWTVSHVGGVYAFESTMLPNALNPRSKFVEFFGGILFLRDKLKAVGELDITYRRNSLRQLPDIPALYTKNRGGDSLHRDSFSYAAHGKTISALGVIGFLHRDMDGRLLSYNDISLPKGGIFDWDTAGRPWRSTHASHREGLDIDINQPLDANGTKERCDFNTSVQAAIDLILTGVPRIDGGNTALLCENAANNFPADSGNYHLDVTFFKPIPAFDAIMNSL